MQFQNLIQQKDLENDQMKTIIYELNTQNKFFREELDKKNQTRSPEFQDLKENSVCNQSNTNYSQIDSKRMETNELELEEMSNRSEELNLNSPEINMMITPIEQKKNDNKEKFETPMNINIVSSFGENQIELKDVSNLNKGVSFEIEISEKKNEFFSKFKKTPVKKIEIEKENILSKTSTERNDGLLESINSSVYEKIVNEKYLNF